MMHDGKSRVAVHPSLLMMLMINNTVTKDMYFADFKMTEYKSASPASRSPTTHNRDYPRILSLPDSSELLLLRTHNTSPPNAKAYFGLKWANNWSGACDRLETHSIYREINGNLLLPSQLHRYCAPFADFLKTDDAEGQAGIGVSGPTIQPPIHLPACLTCLFKHRMSSNYWFTLLVFRHPFHSNTKFFSPIFFCSTDRITIRPRFSRSVR